MKMNLNEVKEIEFDKELKEGVVNEVLTKDAAKEFMKQSKAKNIIEFVTELGWYNYIEKHYEEVKHE